MKTSLKLISLGAALAGAIAVGPAIAAPAAGPAAKPAVHGHAAPGQFGPRDHGFHRAHFQHRGGKHFAGAGEGRGFGALHGLRGLGLSEAQRDAIEDIVDKHHDERRALKKRGRELQRAYRDLDPTAKDYVSKSDKLAEQRAALTRDQLKLKARLESQVIASLTPEQKQKLQTQIAERKARRDAPRTPAAK